MCNASCPEGDMSRGERCTVPVERPIGFQPIKKLSVSYGSRQFIGRHHISCPRFTSERDGPSRHCHTSCVSEMYLV